MSGSLTISRPLPDPRPRWRRLLDGLLRRPAPEPRTIVVHYPNVKVTGSHLTAPDQLAVEFTVWPAAAPTEPLFGGSE